MTPLAWAKFIGILLLGAVIFAATSTVKKWRDDSISYGIVKEQIEQDQAAADGAFNAVNEGNADATRVDREVSTARQASRESYNVAVREDEVVRQFDAAVVPQRLRNIASQRRQFRDCVARGEAGCGADDSAASNRRSDSAN